MKLIQVSDPHLTAPGAELYGIDPLARFGAAVADINERHAEAAMVVISGDLTNSGERAGYEALEVALRELRVPYRLMMGNHDNRDMFRSVFPEAHGEAGFVQFVEDREEGLFVFLDTLDTGKVTGILCKDRLAWLSGKLDEAGDRPIFIFMHHPPVRLGIPVLDSVGLVDEDDLFATLHGRNVRHIFAGHVHRLSGGSWRGIPFTTLRSTWLQFGFNREQGRLSKTLENGVYAVALIRDDDVVVHFHDFMDRSPRIG